MRKLTLALAFLSLFFMLGCVVEKDVSAPENEKVLSAGAEDLDQDSYTDLKRYVFRPIVIDAEENILMQKSVSAAQTSAELTVKSTRELNDANVSRLETLIFEFDVDRRDREGVCKDSIGLGRIAGESCASREECSSLCTTTQCQKYGYASEMLGYWIYDFSENDQELGADISDVRTALVVIKDATPQEKEQIMRKINSIIDRTMAINNNPLFNDNMFGVCAPIDYNVLNLREMLSILGDYERTATRHTYNVNIKFVVTGKDYSEVKIGDGVPKALLLGMRNLSLIQKDSAYDPATNRISWPTIAFNLYPEYMVGYSFQSSQGMREDIFENWPTPTISTRIVSLSKSPVIAYILGTSKYVYSLTKGLGYYPALAIVLAFWVIAFFMIVMAFRLIVSFLGAVFARTGLRDSLVRAFGGANPYWKEYAMACAAFLLIGIALLFAASPVAEETLLVDSIAGHLVQNPPGALALIFLFLAIYIGYALLEDRFKGVIAGRRYYENILDVSPKANELRFRKLGEKLGALKEGIANAGNLDVSEEKNVLISVPMDRIEALLKKEGSERAVKELIEAYADKVDTALARVGEKQKISSDYWAEWSKEISSKLAERDSVALSSLTGIPSEWRPWAANRFAAENEDEGLVIDAEGIRRAESGPEKKAGETLKRLTTKGGALGGVVLGKEGIVTMFSKTGNKTLEGILSWKIANYAKTLGQKILNSEYTKMTITGEKNSVAFAKAQDKEGVLFAPKDKIADALADFEAKLKRL